MPCTLPTSMLCSTLFIFPHGWLRRPIETVDGNRNKWHEDRLRWPIETVDGKHPLLKDENISMKDTDAGDSSRCEDDEDVF